MWLYRVQELLEAQASTSGAGDVQTSVSTEPPLRSPLVDQVKQHDGERLQVDWKYFSLEQVNEEPGPGVTVWDEPSDYKSRGLLAFKAAEAARRQGQEAFARFHIALLAERHEKGRKPITIEVIDDAGRDTGLDLDRLHRDLQDPSMLQALARDHTHAVERYGVFGTPTLVFENGRAAYLKMKPPPPEHEMLDAFDSLRRLVTEREYIAEVKRPRPGARR